MTMIKLPPPDTLSLFNPPAIWAANSSTSRAELVDKPWIYLLSPSHIRVERLETSIEQKSHRPVSATPSKTTGRYIETTYRSMHDEPIINSPSAKPHSKYPRYDNKVDGFIFDDNMVHYRMRDVYDSFGNDEKLEKLGRLSKTSIKASRITHEEAREALCRDLITAKARPVLDTYIDKTRIFNCYSGRVVKSLATHTSINQRLRPTSTLSLSNAKTLNATDTQTSTWSRSEDVEYPKDMFPLPTMYRGGEPTHPDWIAPENFDTVRTKCNSFERARATARTVPRCAEELTLDALRQDSNSRHTGDALRSRFNRLPLRESVLIAQNTRWCTPLAGDKCSMYLDKEFFNSMPAVESIISSGWMVQEEACEQWFKGFSEEAMRIGDDWVDKLEKQLELKAGFDIGEDEDVEACDNLPAAEREELETLKRDMKEIELRLAFLQQTFDALQFIP